MNVLVVMVMGGLIDWKHVGDQFWDPGTSPMTPHVPGAIEALAMLRSRVFLPDQIYFLVRGDQSLDARRRIALWMAHNRIRRITGITPLGSALLFCNDRQGSSASVLHRLRATHVVGWRFEPEELGLPELYKAYSLNPNHPLQSGDSPVLHIADSWQQIQNELLPVRAFTPMHPPPRAMHSHAAQA